MASTKPPPPRELKRPDGVPEDAILRLIPVPAESAGMRLDVFLRVKLKRTSRTRAHRIVRQSAYNAEGKRLMPSDRVREGQVVALWRDPFEGDEPMPPIAVVHEDPHLLVIDKPPLVAVHPTARYHHHTVIKRLQAERPDEYVALIHRIDRETSGLLLLARSLESERAFKLGLERRTEAVASAEGAGEEDGLAFEKEYLAIVRGVPAEGAITLPLELDPDNPLRVKMRIAEPGTGLHARTGVRVLETRGDYSLVACALHTGRQHQIRLHLAAVGCPLVGDKLYGADERMLARAADGELRPEDLLLLELSRHALHAHRYRLRHAVTGEMLELVSPLPRDLSEFWAGCGERRATR